MKSWQKEAVGVEIFSKGARFVRLSFRKDKVELKDFGEKIFPKEPLDFQWLADELGRFLSGARVKITFLGQSSQSYRLGLPERILSAGEEQLKWELAQKVSSSSSEYDFFINSAGKEFFLGTAVRKEAFERVAVPFAQKGNFDLSFTSAGFALVNLFLSSSLPREDSAVLVNLGEDFTTLVVLDKGELTYVSEIAVPPGLSALPEGELASTQKILRESLLERFGIELSTLIHLLGFRATETGRIETVYLSGPGVTLGDLSASIGQMGGVQVGHLTPPVTFPEGETPERWVVATGLAMAALNEGNPSLQPGYSVLGAGL